MRKLGFGRHWMAENSEDFYLNLSDFFEFSNIMDLSHYRPLPGNWCIAVADITGSTSAIEQGRYKDVNLTGVACITAVLNALPGYGIPYVFGGDGAALTVPASVVPQVQRVLCAARASCRSLTCVRKARTFWSPDSASAPATPWPC
jgi:hypothetical protein